MAEFMVGIIVTLFFCLTFMFGQAMGNQEVKTECMRQGSFYVGKYNFECKLKGIESGN
jgi:hypothetical protein